MVDPPYRRGLIRAAARPGRGETKRPATGAGLYSGGFPVSVWAVDALEHQSGNAHGEEEEGENGCH